MDDARRVAQDLGIPYYVMNFKSEFRENVMDYFAQEYLSGRTPNPCIACNRYVKWESLLKRSLDIGADYIATGHYARVEKLPNGRFAVRSSVTAAKDQTYALYNLTQDQLAHTLMPVGGVHKGRDPGYRGQIGLRVAGKPDSQDICFVPDGDYASFIENYTGKKVPEGNFVTAEGRVLGRHRGITHYTVGQRKGLGISLGQRAFVTEIRPETNEVVIGDRQAACCAELKAKQINLMAVEDIPEERRVWAKIRYNHRGGWCTVKRTGRTSCPAGLRSHSTPSLPDRLW